ncbi:hypothetical protein QBC41DRAFT_386608 [Cercophora samala]|uniref:Uncharacterized protein n=1 Tax=Cercophora samala TaxID=330535 RepID=A0AA39YKB4_9PEZI|nr:hypothetical protein QBC41DRAFT_386608 [Cercophora samala]
MDKQNRHLASRTRKWTEIWNQWLDTLSLRGPKNPGTSFIHVQCDCSSALETKIAMGDLQKRATNTLIWVFPDEAAMAEFAGLHPEACTGVQARTYTGIVRMIGEQSGQQVLKNSTIVFDTHCGRYTFPLFLAVAWLILRLAEHTPPTTPTTVSTSVFVLSPNAKTLWTQEGINRHFGHSAEGATVKSIKVDLRDGRQEIQLLTAEPSPVHYLGAEVKRLLAQNPTIPCLVSTILPLGLCLYLYGRVKHEAEAEGFKLHLMTRENAKEEASLISKDLSPGCCVVVLMDSSIRFFPTLQVADVAHSSLLPGYLNARHWDDWAGKPALGTIGMPESETKRFWGLTQRCPTSLFMWDPIQSETDAATTIAGARRKFVELTPWSAWIFEMTLCAIQGIRADGRWKRLVDLPVYPFAVKAPSVWEKAFSECILMLVRLKFVTVARLAPDEAGLSMVEQQGLALTHKGRAVADLMYQHGISSLQEALLILGIRQEPDPTVKLTIAAITATCKFDDTLFCVPRARGIKDTGFDYIQSITKGVGSHLGRRGRPWLILGLLHAASIGQDEVQSFDPLISRKVKLVEGQMNRILGNNPRMAHLAGELTDDQLLRVEMVLCEAMIMNLVAIEPAGAMDFVDFYEDPENPETQEINVWAREIATAVHLPLMRHMWADDLPQPPDMCFGLHFGLKQNCFKFTEYRIDYYRTNWGVVLSDRAVRRVMDKIWPPVNGERRSAKFYREILRTYHNRSV